MHLERTSALPTVTVTDLDVTSSTGADVTIPAATTTLSGLMTAADKDKLDDLNTDATNDGRYLRVDAGAPDQTRASGKVEFSELTTHAEGINVTGKSANQSSNSIYFDNSKQNIMIGEPSTSFGARTTYNTYNVSASLDPTTDLNRVGVEISTLPAVGSDKTSSAFKANIAQSVGGKSFKAFETRGKSSDLTSTDFSYAYYANFEKNGSKNFNFIADEDAPNFFKGDTYIGGTTSRNTRELWESTLTEEQKEQLEAGTLVVPANVSTPGDGSFARQWWYDQQSAEDQALIDSGELEYPSHFQAANFIDTFELGVTTNINLIANEGRGEFKGGVSVTGGSAASIINGMFKPGGVDNIRFAAGGNQVFSINEFGAAIFLPDNTPVAIDCNGNVVGGGASNSTIFFYRPTITGTSTATIFVSADTTTNNGTLNNVSHFYASALTGSGSVSGFENLFVAATSSQQGSSVRGFFSYVPDVAGKDNYNFYAVVDAPNYFKGEVRGGWCRWC